MKLVLVPSQSRQDSRYLSLCVDHTQSDRTLASLPTQPCDSYDSRHHLCVLMFLCGVHVGQTHRILALPGTYLVDEVDVVGMMYHTRRMTFTAWQFP